MFRYICISLLASPIIAAAAPTQILGIPLGAKLSYSPAVCPINTDKAQRICWIGQPFKGVDGSRLGHAHIPDPDSRPKWAAYTMFELTVASDRTVKEIKVKSENTERAEILASIAARFGAPRAQGPQSANWFHSDVHVEMLCASNTKCWTTFKVPPSEEEIKRAAARQAREKSRPITP